ncbi:hypothetical protein [Acrocarpospora sp. B8E8]|uniref:hypothetical protein n=1 Tax=Acrocarpospora sp. B8E8 TaxID=3153572 RepID=UPI00325C5E6B
MEDRVAAGERQTREKGAARPADAEQHGQGEPEQACHGWCGRVAHLEAEEIEQNASEAGDACGEGEYEDPRPVHTNAGCCRGHLGTADGQHGTT